MEQRSRTGLYLVGCLGAILVLACTTAVGAGGGYFAWQVWQDVEPTLTAQAGRSGTLLPPASPTPRWIETPVASAATPTPRPTARPTPTPVPEPTPTPGPAVIPDWPTYEDPGYIRFQHPPNWLVVTTPEFPESGYRSCHCYWILMSEQMVQNSPSPESVADWFNSRSLDDLVPGSIYLEILRLDSEWAPAVSFGTPEETVVIGGQYSAEGYTLDDQGRIIAFRYHDQHGRPWAIVIRMPSGYDENNPQVRRTIGILMTIDHR
ncbi:MAG: hypothetical protein NZL87_05070 [Thermomicrobium sp.]|nr:hypothetical protein [Thermomicrobium sp.]